MGIAQWVMIFLIVTDASAFMLRNTMKDTFGKDTGINILACVLRYTVLVAVLSWGGFWNV